jgi:hypothetical protein
MPCGVATETAIKDMLEIGLCEMRTNWRLPFASLPNRIRSDLLIKPGTAKLTSEVKS